MAPAEAVCGFGGVFGFGSCQIAGVRDKGGKAGVVDLVAVDGKCIHLDLMAGLFICGFRMVGAHDEGTGRDLDLGRGLPDQQQTTKPRDKWVFLVAEHYASACW